MDRLGCVTTLKPTSPYASIDTATAGMLQSLLQICKYNMQVMFQNQFKPCCVPFRHKQCMLVMLYAAQYLASGAS